MKALDIFIRWWRVRLALGKLPPDADAVFDIGCDDSYLLLKLPERMVRHGCDPRLKHTLEGTNYHAVQTFFPDKVLDALCPGPYDAVFALAVFEHFSDADLRTAGERIAAMLSETGLLIVTVPHPFVDTILSILTSLKLIDGQALEEHHAFDPDALAAMLSPSLQMVKRESFQLGLNNLFIFRKSPHVDTP